MNEITHDYVIIKLVNAETIVCVMVGEDDESFTVMYPIQMKPSRIELEGNKKEFQVGVPWIPYSDEKVFTIYKQDVVLLQKLNQATIEYYKNLVDMNEIEEYEEPVMTEEVGEFLSSHFFIKGNNTIH